MAKESVLRERGELPKEEGDAVRENRAMHEENFWSSWLREDERGKEERTARAEKNEEERCEKRRIEEEKEENQTGSVLWRPLTSFVKGETWRDVVICFWAVLLEKPEDLSDCEPHSCARKKRRGSKAHKRKRLR